MTVLRAGARSTKQAAAENFTGVVLQDEVIVGKPPSRMRATVVSFTPGARTAWHSHPVGQVLYCLSGVGRLCLKGQAPQVLNPGDTGITRPTPCTGTVPRRTACSPISRCRRAAMTARARRGFNMSATRNMPRHPPPTDAARRPDQPACGAVAPASPARST